MVNDDAYAPISESSIRIVKFFPEVPYNIDASESHRRDPTDFSLRAIIKTVPAPSSEIWSERSSFHALSYTWGDGKRSDDVYLKVQSLENYDAKKEIFVLRSLVPFLDQVRQNPKLASYWWWIDSICIDQSNENEKADQIPMMGDIYRRADKVMVWLGDEMCKINARSSGQFYGTCHCRLSVEILINLAEHRLGEKNGKQGQKANEEHKSIIGNKYWNPVRDLLGRSWWTRWWTLQEVLMKDSKNVIFRVGSHSISGILLDLALCEMYDLGVPDDFPFEAAWNRRRLADWWKKSHKEGLTLLGILPYLAGHDASRPEDRLWACLTLVKQDDRNIIPPVIIGKHLSVEHLYTRLVENFYHSHESLDIVCFGHLFSDASNAQIENTLDILPSWVPDWRVKHRSMPVPLMVSQSGSSHIGNCRPPRKDAEEILYDAPGEDQRAKSEAIFGLTYLEENGIIVDTIDGLSGSESIQTRCDHDECKKDNLNALVQSDHTNRVHTKSVKDLQDIISRSLALNAQDKYLAGKAGSRFAKAFVTLSPRHIDNEMPEPGYKELKFKEWLNENRGLDFGGITLEQIMTREHNDPHAKLSDASKKFLKRFHSTVSKMSRRLMTTKEGYIGMAPCRARKGDSVVILCSCSVPLVLRPVAHGSTGEVRTWKLIGEAYLDGFMNGEVGDAEPKRIRLV